jgi:hypothetical protein
MLPQTRNITLGQKRRFSNIVLIIIVVQLVKWLSRLLDKLTSAVKPLRCSDKPVIRMCNNYKKLARERNKRVLRGQNTKYFISHQAFLEI